MPTPPPPPVNTAPAVSAIADKVSDQDTVVGPIEFSIADRESDASQLTVSAAADGTSVVPADGITIGGTGAVRSITLTPLEAATGHGERHADGDRSAGRGQHALLRRDRECAHRVHPRVGTNYFRQGGSDEVTAMNGFTFTQDADDPAIFEPLIGVGEE